MLNEKDMLKKDYSQFGEQKILLDYFSSHTPTHNIIVDVGAYSSFISNSMGLLSCGWKGLLIEPTPTQIPILERDFFGKNVKIINVGVSDKEDEMDFYIHSVPSHNSFLPESFCTTKTDEVIKVKVRLLQDILKENSIPIDFDVLSIDAEGMDEKIMASFLNGSDYRPKIIICEKAKEFLDFMSCGYQDSWGYRIFTNTEANMFFEYTGI